MGIGGILRRGLLEDGRLRRLRGGEQTVCSPDLFPLLGRHVGKRAAQVLHLIKPRELIVAGGLQLSLRSCF